MTDEFSAGPTTDKLADAEMPPNREAKEPKPDGRTMTNDERIAHGMKPRGRKPGSAAPAKKRVSLEGELIAYLSLANLLFAFAPEEYRGDALDDLEIAALAKTTNDAAMANAQLYKYLEMILRGGTGGIVNLVVVVGCIVGRRLARHGAIPVEFDNRMATMIAATVDPEAAMRAMMGNAESVAN